VRSLSLFLIVVSSGATAIGTGGLWSLLMTCCITCLCRVLFGVLGTLKTLVYQMSGRQIPSLMQSVFPSATIITTTARAVNSRLKLFKLYHILADCQISTSPVTWHDTIKCLLSSAPRTNQNEQQWMPLWVDDVGNKIRE
jgi:hypothetical protein